jgi:hypothetical protein
MVAAKADWVPERQQIIWIDCNPQAGREMRDRHPFLVLSPRAFNERTSLVIRQIRQDEFCTLSSTQIIRLARLRCRSPSDGQSGRCPFCRGL